MVGFLSSVADKRNLQIQVQGFLSFDRFVGAKYGALVAERPVQESE